jgi:DNA polymerase III epsilon subunit-like protein
MLAHGKGQNEFPSRSFLLQPKAKGMTLLLDCETTGKADFRLPADAPSQPRLVQLGALLLDSLGVEIASLNCIIKPDGFEIPEEATAVNGISTQMAIEKGLERSAVLPVFAEMARVARVIVAHNLQFDELVMDGEFLRGNYEISPFETDARMFCTMKAMTPLCKLPNQYGYSDYKWPRLEEAYRFAFNETFNGHDAMSDTRACARLYRWLMERQKVS